MNVGIYEAIIVEHCAAWSSKGTPSITVKFCIENVAGEQEAIWGDIWLSEAALGMARQRLKACGFDVDKEDVGILDSNRNHLSGRKVQIEVVEEEFNGQTRLKVGRIGDTRPKDAAQQLSAFTKSLREVKKAGKADPATCKHKRYTRKDGVSVCKDCGTPKVEKAEAPKEDGPTFPPRKKVDPEKHCGGKDCALPNPNECGCYCAKCDAAQSPF